MKLSQLKPGSYQVEGAEPLKLSGLPHGSYQVEEPKGVQVYNKPIGPEEDTVHSRVEKLRPRLAEGYEPPIIMPLAGPAGLAKNAVTKFLTQNPFGRVATDTALGSIPNLKEDRGGGMDGAKTSLAISSAFNLLPYGVGKLLPKAAAALTGKRASDIVTYAQSTDDVNKIIKGSGGNLSVAADDVRQGFQDAIRSKRASLGANVGAAVDAADPSITHDLGAVRSAIEQQKSRLHPVYDADAIDQIDDVLAKITKSVPSNAANAHDLADLKDFLQGRASSAYMKSGQVFQSAPGAAQGAKSGGAIARKLFNSAVPGAASANQELSLLHRLEKDTNRNLLAPGKSDSALFAAGSGANSRNFRNLERLGQMADYPIIDKAKKLSAAAAFKDAEWLPSDLTGKSLTRLATGFGVGTLASGGALGAGSVLGALATSPAALKLAINAANTLGKAVPVSKIVEMAQKNPGQLQTMIREAGGDPDAEVDIEQAPQILGDTGNTKTAVGRRLEKAK